MYLTGVLVILYLSILASAKMLNHGKIVVCPIDTQSFISQANDFKINETDWGTFCTHIIVREHTPEFKMPPDDETNEDFMQITGLKQKFRHLKISSAAPVKLIYKKFIESTDANGFFTNYLDFLIKHNFHGVDIHFGNLENTLIQIEQMSTKSEDFLIFLRQLKRALSDRNLFMTTSFVATLDFTSSMKFDASEYIEVFEFFHLNQVARHTDEAKDTFGYILSEMKPSNVEQKIMNLINIWKIPPSKLVLGVWLGGPGVVTRRKENIMEAKRLGFYSYNKGCEILAGDRSFERMFDSEHQLVRLTVNFGDETDVYTYPRPRTIAFHYMKRIVVKAELAGAMALHLNDDDYRGLCKLDNDTFDDFNRKSNGLKVLKRPDSKFPIMHTINEGIYLAIGDDESADKPTVEGVTAYKPTTGGASSFMRNLFDMSFLVVGILSSALQLIQF